MYPQAWAGMLAPSAMARRALSSRDSAYHNERLFSGDDGLGQRSIRRIVREVFFAGKKSKKRAPLQSHVITNCAAQHGITRFERIEDGTLGDWRGHIQRDLAAHMGKTAKVCWQNDANHS